MLKKMNNKVWLYFVLHPGESVHIRELARRLKLSPTSVLAYSKPLLKEKLVISKREGRNLVLTTNQANQAFQSQKKWTNLALLVDSGLIDKLNEAGATSIILFGSFSRGEDTERSDIDLAVDSPIRLELGKFESMLNRKIQLHSIGDLPALLRENVRQGLLLEGVMV